MIVLMIVHSQQSSWLPSERSEMERECSRISISGDERAGDGEADIEGKGRGFTKAQTATIAGKPVALVASMNASPVAGLMPSPMRPETNGMAAKLLR
jgi:hypothetical protein